MRAPLWLTVEGKGPDVTVSLAKCRNCGEVKLGSNPCGFDHLAAVMEFNDYIASIPAPTTSEPQP